MSIVRIGLAETKHFGEGYEAIFGVKQEEPKKTRKRAKSRVAKKPVGRKSKAKRK